MTEQIETQHEKVEQTPDSSEQNYHGNVTSLPSADRGNKLRILEALLFAASEPLDAATLSKHLSEDDDIEALIEELKTFYASRGVNLVKVSGKWAFRTADDLSYLLEQYAVETKTPLKGLLWKPWQLLHITSQ